MTGGIEYDAIGLSLGKGGGYWSVLLDSTGVEGKKRKKSLGKAFERRVTDRIGGIISMV